MSAPMPPAPPLPPGLAAAPAAVPVGTVLAFAGEVAAQAMPLAARGYLVCDGRELAVSEFPELFLAIGYRYSPKAGESTFCLPDLRGYFLRGVDPDGAVDPDHQDRTLPDGTSGPNVGSVQHSAFQAHEHDYSPATPSGEAVAGQSGTVGAGTAATSGVVDASGAATALTSKVETRPINVYVYYVIRYTSCGSPHHPAVPPVLPWIGG